MRVDVKSGAPSDILKPLCRVREFLDICVFPNMTQLFNLVCVDKYVTAATPVLSLLTIAVEAMEKLTWSELVQCEPVPLVFSVCYVINVCLTTSVTSSAEILPVKELAAGALKGLIAVTCKYRDSVPRTSVDCGNLNHNFC